MSLLSIILDATTDDIENAVINCYWCERWRDVDWGWSPSVTNVLDVNNSPDNMADTAAVSPPLSGDSPLLLCARNFCIANSTLC